MNRAPTLIVFLPQGDEGIFAATSIPPGFAPALAELERGSNRVPLELILTLTASTILLGLQEKSDLTNLEPVLTARATPKTIPSSQLLPKTFRA
jgi:hypothetical protein